MHRLGRALWGRGMVDDAEGRLRRAAEGGHVPAMADLGNALAYPRLL
jgi:hypothetical protein